MQEIEVILKEGRIVPMQPTQSPKIYIKKLENEHNLPYITTSCGQPLLQGAHWTALITGGEDIDEGGRLLNKLMQKDSLFLDETKLLNDFSHEVN
jgi:hypothetical protein